MMPSPSKPFRLRTSRSRTRGLLHRRHLSGNPGGAAVQRAAELGFLHKVNDGSVGGLYWTGSNLVRLSDNSLQQQTHRLAQDGSDVMTPFVVCGSGVLMVGSSWMARCPGNYPDPDVVAITVDTVRPRLLCRSGRRIEISRNCFNGRGSACWLIRII